MPGSVFVGLLALVLALLAGPALATDDDGWYKKNPLVVTEFVDKTATTAGCFDVGCTYGFTSPVALGGSPKGKRVGRTAGICTVLAPSSAAGGVNYCLISITLDKYGTITVQGRENEAKGAKSDLAITGGTGRYTGASGVLVSEVLEPGKAWKYTIKFDKKEKKY